MPCWLQWASGFSDVYLCNFASLFLLYPHCSPGTHSHFHLTPTQKIAADYTLVKALLVVADRDVQRACWRNQRSKSVFPRENISWHPILQLRFGKWEMGFQSFCSIEKPIGHRVVFFLWQFKGLRNWKTEMKNWALNMLEWKTRNSFRIASQNDAHECFLISSQTYLLCLALVLDINLEERNRPIWIWFLQGYLGWEVHPPRHQREGFFGFVSLPLPSLQRDNSHNLHDHKRSLVRTRWTMLAVTSP